MKFKIDKPSVLKAFGKKLKQIPFATANDVQAEPNPDKSCAFNVLRITPKMYIHKMSMGPP